jgi:hypothetical protein
MPIAHLPADARPDEVAYDPLMAVAARAKGIRYLSCRSSGR